MSHCSIFVQTKLGDFVYNGRKVTVQEVSVVGEEFTQTSDCIMPDCCIVVLTLVQQVLTNKEQQIIYL